MSLETAVYINTLDPNQPAGDDPVAQADDHLRMIKAAIKATFPNVTGPVNVTQADMNSRGVPSGAILMWSGSVASIPAGWLLCNGASGTPNLQDRFIVGAGSGYAVGAQGGNVTASSSINGSHSHTTDVQGSHSHGGATGNHWLSIDEIPSHSHGVPVGGATSSGVQPFPQQGFYNNIGPAYNTEHTGGSGPHNHLIYADGAHGHNLSTQPDHSHTVDTRSPYYALAYIMKA